MDAYQIRKRVRDDSKHRDVAGPARPHPPRVENDDPLHGDYILMLKDLHQCFDHWGKHGEPGYCYKPPGHAHVGLNDRRFGVWAAGMAAGVATCYVPPNCPEFDGLQYGGLAGPKPCGRAPPAAAPPTIVVPAPAPASPDLSTMLVAALIPLLTALTHQNGGAAPAPVLPANHPAEPDKAKRALSPHLTPTLCIWDCLVAFKTQLDIDISHHETTLTHRDLSPDIIPEVPHNHLSGVLGISEGKTLRFQHFCRDWSACQSRKLMRQL